MDEILFELRDHSAGLNCGRWDYIFSLIKKLGKHERFVLSDRGLVTMTTPFMRAYSLLTIRTCHRRGVHAMGGMAAQIPIKGDAYANQTALEAVRADKRRECEDGHDGTWVAHPGLVGVAREEFAKVGGDNQIHRDRTDVRVSAADLLDVPQRPHISEAGVRKNINVGLQYLESWLRGNGCVPINHLMEDAATAEISRAQLWQWARHRARTIDDRVITVELVERMMTEELDKLRAALGEERFARSRFERAHQLFVRMIRADACPEFLTSLAYDLL
jgi:malate synthase